MTAPAPEILRDGLLDGVVIVLAGAQDAEGSVGVAAAGACTALGARVEACAIAAQADPEQQEAAAEAAAERALAAAGPADVLLVDVASLFARGGPALLAALAGSWALTRAVAGRAFLAAARPGRVLLLAPPAGAGEHAPAARAAVENLARTLSIEWARHAVTAVAIAPAEDTREQELATLVAYLCSPAGAYFSGCLLDLRRIS